MGAPSSDRSFRISPAAEGRGIEGGQGKPVDTATLSAAVSRELASSRWAVRIQQLELQVRIDGYRPDPGRLAQEILTAAEIDARITTMIEN
jgi:hypothetical protein